MKRKKLLLVGAMILSLCGCGNSGAGENEKIPFNLIDSNGLIISHKVENTEDIFTSNMNYGLVNEKGEVVLDNEYDQVIRETSKYYSVMEDEKSMLVDAEGKVVLEGTDTLLHMQGKFFYQDKKETIVYDESLKELERIEGVVKQAFDSYYVIEKDEKQGLFTTDGKEIIAAKYDSISPVSELRYIEDSERENYHYAIEYVSVEKNGNVAIYDVAGKEILPFEYQLNSFGYTDYLSDYSVFELTKDGNVCLIDKKGNIKYELYPYEINEGRYRNFNSPSIIVDKGYILVNKGTEIVRLNDDLKEELKFSGNSNMQSYSNGLILVNDDFEEFTDSLTGQTAVSSRTSKIIDEKGNVVFETKENAYSEGGITSLDLTDDLIFVEEYVKEEQGVESDLLNDYYDSYGSFTSKYTIYDHNNKVVKEFAPNEYTFVNLLRDTNEDKTNTYIVAQKDQEDGVSKTTIFDKDGKEVTTFDGSVNTIYMSSSKYFVADMGYYKEVEVTKFDEYIGEYTTFDYIHVDKDGNETENTYGLVDLNGNVMIDGKYSSIDGFFYDDEMIVASTDKNSTIFDKDFNEVLTSPDGIFF